MDTLIFAANAILPIIILIILGYYLKQRHFFEDEFLKVANKLVFKVALPTLLFYNVYNIQDLKTMQGDIILFAVMMILILFGLGLLTSLLFIPKTKQKGVILQCVFRSNYAIIGITLAESIGGEAAVAMAAILSAFSIPLFNVLAVVALSLFGADEKQVSIKQVLKGIYKNPLVRGVFLGFVCLVIRLYIPVNSETHLPVFGLKYDLPFLYKACKSLSQLASPLALIVLGGQFQFSAIKSLKKIIIGTSWRLVLAPLLALSCAEICSNHLGIIHLTAVDYPALIALFGSPVAVSSAIMAGEMGADEKLAGQLVVWTSLFSMLTLFIIVSIFKGIGILS
ncbi:AEC family transporter [Cellulosilyticum ruminicola]|uniref:AEC family transporter n=1 Tax=Cellulosilyticum ruminicola TaxID=425254 RepID=UPI0006D27133|nr:AEC family transporter [Cellulosilyticum ruminicola]